MAEQHEYELLLLLLVEDEEGVDDEDGDLLKSNSSLNSGLDKYLVVVMKKLRISMLRTRNSSNWSMRREKASFASLMVGYLISR